MRGKTLQSTIEISGVLSPSLQSAIKNAVSKLEEMSKETLDSAGAAEKLCAEISAQESVLKSLQKGYADYIVSGKESSSEARTLADKIQELSGELEENRGTLQAAEKAAKQLADTQDGLSGELSGSEKKLRQVGDAAEDAGRKAEDSSEGYTILKNVIANLASEAIGKAVEAFKELATEGDSALGKLEAKTGASGEQMAGLKDVMYEVYNANYGDSLGDVSDTLSTVVQMTDDLDNASLAKVTKSAIALDDVFGFDVTESMRAVNSLMDKFGISSDEAFNLIVQGAQNGLNQNDDLLDTINEYSVQFKDAGYTADDMFNMLANGAESGTWSVDKLGDAVKEFNIRASDGTISKAIEENAKAFGMSKKEAESLGSQIEGGSVEAYQKLLDKLKEVDDDAQRYQLGVSMFGTMWEDLGEDAVFALMDTEGAISKTSDAMAKMDSAAYDTLESSLSQLGRTISSEVVQPIADKLIPVAKTAVEFVTNSVGPAVDWVLNNLPTISVLLAGISAAIVAFKWGSIVSGITKAIGAVKAFGAALMANPIGLIILAVTALVAAFVYLWNNCEAFRNFWINLWENVKGAASAAAEWIKNAWNTIKSATSAAWNSIKSTVSTVWSGIKAAVSAAINAVKSVVSSVWNGIKAATSSAWNSIKTAVSNTWNGIKSGVSNAVNAVKSTVSNVWNGIKSVTSSVWNGIKTAIITPIEAAKNKIKGIVDAIKGFFSNMKLNLPNIKLPHFKVEGKLSISPPSVPKLSIDWYKEGGIMTRPTIFGASGSTLMAGGEAGAEAVLPLAVLWDKMDAILRRILSSESSAGGTSDEGLTSKAGELLALENFSLGSLADGTNVVIYYDFSHFTWSPQIQTSGAGDDEDDLMARLKAHEAEFFEWLEEFVKMREVAQYA